MTTKNISSSRRFVFAAAALAGLAALAAPELASGVRDARAFSQCGGPGCAATPLGHEYLTAESAKGIPALVVTKNEITAEVGCSTCEQYGTQSLKIWSAVMGQRWVDTMGFSAVTNKKCFDAVAQNPDDVQADHFLRTSTQTGTQGRTDAIAAGRNRLKLHFINAVAANDDIVAFKDGGAAPLDYKAKRSYFLLGRAMHLLQDSFSPEHTLRTDSKYANAVLKFGAVEDVKSYLCTHDAPQHVHANPTSAEHGDVIWKSRTAPSTQDNLKDLPKAALAASHDLWVAFEAAHAVADATQRHAQAEQLIDALLAKWFTTGGLAVVHSTPNDCHAETQQTITADRTQCLQGLARLAGENLKPSFDHK